MLLLHVFGNFILVKGGKLAKVVVCPNKNNKIHQEYERAK